MRLKLIAPVLLTMAFAAAGCGGGGAGTSTSGATSGTTTSGMTQTVPAHTAADDLAPFFAGAQSLDRQLAAAAVLINGGIHTTTMSFDQATLDAIAAIKPESTAATIPVGLPPDLERAALLVQSELVSRRASFNHVTKYPEDHPYVLRCLALGAPAAARFAADLAAARSLAGRTPPITVAAPDSRAAADRAIYLRLIDGENNCCYSCGGFVLTRLPPISWGPRHGWDGAVGGLLFKAHYLPTSGWRVELNAG